MSFSEYTSLYPCHLLLLDKPSDLTSAKAAHRVKKLLGIKKIGHTGTLDPIATGMLPLCLNDATRFSQYLLSKDKHYTAEGKLGSKTDTADRSGTIIQTCDKQITRSQLETAIKSYIGTYEQTPPMYSALHHQGKRLHEWARAGVEVARKTRKVSISSISLIDFSPPFFTIDVHCQTGTYIRSLMEDIASSIGHLAHMTQLRRNWVSPLNNKPMVTLDEIIDLADFNQAIVPIDTIMELPSIQLDHHEVKDIKHGKIIHRSHEYMNDTECKLYCNESNRFIGVAICQNKSLIKAKRLLPTK